MSNDSEDVSTKADIVPCVLCGKEAKGNKKHRYFCKACNVLFDKEH